MSFDMNPADEDPHGECRREIHDLQHHIADWKHATGCQTPGDFRNAGEELHRLRQLANKQQDEIETLREMADAVEALRDIGKLIGCGHVDDPDGRRQLVNCVEQEFDTLKEAAARWQEQSFRPLGDNHHNAALCPHCSPRSKIVQLQAQLAAVRAKLETIVCTDGVDKGVILKSSESPTHTEVIGGRSLTVYDHEYFSELGDALVDLWELTKEKQ